MYVSGIWIELKGQPERDENLTREGEEGPNAHGRDDNDVELGLERYHGVDGLSVSLLASAFTIRAALEP